MAKPSSFVRVSEALSCVGARQLRISRVVEVFHLFEYFTALEFPCWSSVYAIFCCCVMCVCSNPFHSFSQSVAFKWRKEVKRMEWDRMVWICLRSVDAAISSTMRWTVGALSGEPFYALCVGSHSHSIVCGQRSKPMRPKWERAKKKVFINDLSIELETVHITDDFETHNRLNAGIRQIHSYVINLSRSVVRCARPKYGRKTTAAAGSSGVSSKEKCPTYRGKMTVSSF